MKNKSGSNEHFFISQPLKKYALMNNAKCQPSGYKKSNARFFDNFFNNNIGNFLGSDNFINQPSVNVMEGDDKFSIELAAPGLEKGDFDITIDKNLLTIAVSKEQREAVENERFTRREFSFSSFKRSFQIPETVNAANISAAYENGVLNLTLPKKEEAKALPKQSIKIS